MFRYDCRGHLYRLEDFDFSKEKSYQELSTEEIDVENICDEERYKDLDKDMIEEEILEGEGIYFVSAIMVDVSRLCFLFLISNYMLFVISFTLFSFVEY